MYKYPARFACTALAGYFIAYPLDYYAPIVPD